MRGTRGGPLWDIVMGQLPTTVSPAQFRQPRGHEQRWHVGRRMAQQVCGKGSDDHLVTDDRNIAGSLLNREDDVEEPMDYILVAWTPQNKIFMLVYC